jgi:hypothetical protein
LEVAPSVICVEELTRSSSEELEVICLTQELELGVSEALGVSLSEVYARYFGDSDVGTEIVEEKNYGDVIGNHYWSSRYLTKDIDGVPFTMYNSNN